MGHGVIAWIIIGVIAGWLTGKIMRGSGFGFFVDMIVGLVGAFFGGWLWTHLGGHSINEHGLIMSIIIATFGAVILTWLFRLVTGSKDS
ncbi:GlsB/YeaQ/YmgE family stress response membrane protein [Granulicella cerasi]|uniref:GlsB/YeaQ/YmgE family stress response membrane protein n=1 Tax=Granulicella cerasi TaxID=741063 RepID=A0ABW1Z7I1_9BACT|nr:GlsB/YeaQ/YmgE family stress response membrane protein [Granulicella cerasi]